MLYDESKISPNGISTPQESSDSYPLVSGKRPKPPSQTPISTKLCLKRLNEVEMLAESYNLLISSSRTDKGFRKEQSNKKLQRLSLSINANLIKSKKDSIKNIKFTQNVSSSSIPAYSKKQSEGKETNPSGRIVRKEENKNRKTPPGPKART